MLENPVDVPEYLLVTDELHDGASSGPAMRHLDLDLEGIGSVRTHVVDVGDLAALSDLPSWPQRTGGTFAMVGRGLPYAVGRRRAPALASGG